MALTGTVGGGVQGSSFSFALTFTHKDQEPIWRCRSDQLHWLLKTVIEFSLAGDIEDGKMEERLNCGLPLASCMDTKGQKVMERRNLVSLANKEVFRTMSR